MTIEIVSFPIKNGGFSIVMLVYQREIDGFSDFIMENHLKNWMIWRYPHGVDISK
jgi:hypothetical protein